ncbi:uncharacterized protein LOC141528905 [Cotesia typhae]|uniref:uncharacterized protein LOC141528905 n=1 Tax=Cotesia typhae TaxID=2053667 RepID=UPI003D69ACE7
MPDTLSKHSPIAANSGVASDNNLLLQNQSDPIDVQSLLIDKCSYNQDYQQGLENNQENICKSIDRQSSSVKKNSPKADKKVLDNSPKKPFKEIFTLPVEYLPKKKRCRVEKSGKSKLPSVGTSDEWYQSELEKEKIKKQQQDKKLKRKELQDEKKKLQEKVKEIQKKLKEEK